MTERTPTSGLPKVSVVIPNYNYAQYIDDCLESVLTQTGVDIDVPILHDTPLPGTLDRIPPELFPLKHSPSPGAAISTHVPKFDDVLFTGKFVSLITLDTATTSSNPDGYCRRVVSSLPAAATISVPRP